MLKKSLIVLGIIASLLILSCEIKYLSEVSKSICQIQTIVKEPVKPTYDYLKSVTVYIEGCVGKDEITDKLRMNQMIEETDEGFCWSGTGVIIKITDKETYILSNNHVIGKGEVNPIIFVENTDNKKVRAEIIKYADYVDIAVIKLNTILKDKRAIKGIVLANIQDPTIYLR